MKLKKEKVIPILKYIPSLIAGTFLVAAGTVIFFSPNKIVCGGVGGISTILLHTMKIPLSLSYALINVILLLLGLRSLGKEFIIKTLAGTAFMTLFTELLSNAPPVTTDPMLASLFGGCAYGIGLGIIFVIGSTTGGTDILGRLFQLKFPHISISIMMLIIDAVIITVSFVVFRDFELIMFGLIGIVMQSVSMEMLIHKLNVSKVAFVISDFGEEINDDLIADFSRGVTMIKGQGGFMKNDKKIVMCALKDHEVEELRKRVTKIDPGAFVVFTESQFIDGNGFIIYR